MKQWFFNIIAKPAEPVKLEIIFNKTLNDIFITSDHDNFISEKSTLKSFKFYRLKETKYQNCVRFQVF